MPTRACRLRVRSQPRIRLRLSCRSKWRQTLPVESGMFVNGRLLQVHSVGEANERGASKCVSDDMCPAPLQSNPSTLREQRRNSYWTPLPREADKCPVLLGACSMSKAMLPLTSFVIQHLSFKEGNIKSAQLGSTLLRTALQSSCWGPSVAFQAHPSCQA